jgi:prepilin-type N-terminal cleavage/methylation domain-containing protein
MYTQPPTAPDRQRTAISVHQRGFTIVELLIVIVVIGILAAITIVAYNGIQGRAQIASIQSDLSGNVNKFEMYKLDDANAAYPTTLVNLQTADLKFSKNAYTWVLYCTDTTSYVVAARLINTSRWWVAGSTGSPQESNLPGSSGSSTTTCTNLGYASPTYAVWIKSNTGWAF